MNGVAALLAERLRRLSSGDGLRAQLVRGGMGSLAVKAAHAGLAFALAVVLARLLGPEGYGVYAFALAILLFTAIPAQVGIPQLVVRETAKTQANQDWGLMRGLWRWGNIAVSGFSVLGALVAGGILLVLSTPTDAGRAATVAIGIPLIPLIALANVRAASLRGLRMVVWGQLPESVFRPTLLLVLVGGWIVISGTEVGVTPEHVMGLHVFAAVLTFLVGGAMLWKARPEGVKRRPIPHYKCSAWQKAVIPLATISGLQLINNYADLIVLGIYRPVKEVGIYRAVFQVALLVIFGLQALNQVLQPHIARLYERGEMDSLRRLVTTGARTILALALPPVLIFMVFGSELLRWVFGDEFHAGYVPLAILGIGQLINAGMGPVAMLLNMTGHEQDTMFGVAFAAVLNIMLNLIFIPLFGMEGAAVASAVTLVFWNSVLWFSVRRRLSINAAAL